LFKKILKIYFFHKEKKNPSPFDVEASELEEEDDEAIEPNEDGSSLDREDWLLD
jgi:hypothetical protein